jgi:hypothetical protein
MRRLLVAVALLVVAAANAEVIEKWRTPDGGLHLGRNPPPGSTLLATVEFEDREPAAEGDDSTAESLARAAADGREIIRRRLAAREAQRATRDSYAWVPPPPESTDIVVFSTFDDFCPPRFFDPDGRCRLPRHPHHGFSGTRPAPPSSHRPVVPFPPPGFRAPPVRHDAFAHRRPHHGAAIREAGRERGKRFERFAER